MGPTSLPVGDDCAVGQPDRFRPAALFGNRDGEIIQRFRCQRFEIAGAPIGRLGATVIARGEAGVAERHPADMAVGPATYDRLVSEYGILEVANSFQAGRRDDSRGLAGACGQAVGGVMTNAQ